MGHDVVSRTGTARRSARAQRFGRGRRRESDGRNVERGRFSVALVPHTLEVTTLGVRKPGDSVNLETDIIGKYIQKYLGAIQQGK